MVSCAKELQQTVPDSFGSTDVHSLSVGIEAGEYLPTDATKASMNAIVRVDWKQGDKVSVVNASTGYILGGYLTADSDGAVTTFSGDVSGTLHKNDKLYYIFPALDVQVETLFSEQEISLKAQTYDATKSNEVCFHGYAEDTYSGDNSTETHISKSIKFNPVTAYVHLNMSNIPAKNADLTSIDLSNVNGGFKWVLEDKTVSAQSYLEDQGISVTCSNTKISQSGNAVVRFAVPASPATVEARVLTVNKAYSLSNYSNAERRAAAYYNQLYSTWVSSNVKVYDKDTEVNVKVDNGGSTESAEAALPVVEAFKSGKTEGTKIEMGGVGTITFDQTATNKILGNAEGSTSVFFKVEDVTKDTDVEKKNIVYEVTMKTVDQDGKEVFSEANAAGEATVEVPLGDNVVSVEKVTLLDANGNPIAGGVVENSHHFDAVSRILSFRVVHFSKYAIEYEKRENPINRVATIGERGYESLASAIAAAQNGNTIKMFADFATTDKVTVGADKNIILDLNGKTISYTTDEHGSFIENKGQLKIIDSGQNGIITAAFNNPNWSDGCYTINNAGTYDKAGKLVIESGTIENTSPGKGLAWPISNGIYGTNADLVINGGTIHSVNYVPVREYLQCGGKKTIVINGGKFISDNSRAIAIQVNDATIQDTGSSVTINGGVFTCKGSGILYVDMHAANANLSGFTMTINGGKFSNGNTSAPVLVYDDEGNSQTSAVLLSKILKGGTYSKEPASELLADGYAAKRNTDGSWTVEIENFWPNFAVSSFSNINEGAKTITISSPAELALLAKKINGGTSYAGYTISINGSLDMGAHFWIPINAYSKGSLRGATIKGVNGATIANLKIEKAIYKGNYDYYAGFIAQAAGVVTFKDLTFSGAVSVDNGSGVATVLGQTYGNVLFDNVKVVNSTVSAETKAGSLLGFTGGDGIKVTVKDCSLDNVTVKAEYSYALMVGLVNTNDQVVFEGSNTATNSHAVLDETIAASDFQTRKTIKGYTYGVDDTKLWVIGVQDAWAECRSNPTPKKNIDGVEYSVMGDIFYHAGGVVVDICAPDPVAQIGNTKYATLDEAFAAVQAGQTIEIVKAGTYTVPNISYNITVEGAVTDVVFNCEGSGSIASIPNGSTFKNVTMNFGNSGYHGFQHAGHIIMDGCILNGLFFSYGDMTFKGCTFNQENEEYNMWCYGNDVTYDGCTFNSKGKFLNVYNEGNDDGTPWNIVAKDCVFNTSKANKAALNIKETCNAIFLKYNVTVKNCSCNELQNSLENKDDGSLYRVSSIWQVDDRKDGATGINVTVDGLKVYPFCSKDADGNYHIINAAGLLQFHDLYADGKVAYTAKVYIDNDIDFTGKTWTACEWHADGNKKGFALFDGQNHTIKNFTVSGQGMFSRWACIANIGATPYFKDIVFDGAKNVTSTLNVSLFCGQVYQNAKIENVTIKNSQFEGTYKVAPFVGTVYDEKPAITATLTMKDCKVENTTVRSTKYNYCTCGMVAWVSDIDDNDKIVFEGNNVVEDVTLYKSNVNYNLFGRIYWGDGGDDGTAHDEAANVTVSNVNIVPVQ
ncbi:MAG: hypothetical protein MJY77_08740 [Bacteroidaceae bacterium]|nr:hypothetical protein [Bacteroidaceae bacterium]